MKITKPDTDRFIIKLTFALYVALMIWLLFGQRFGEQTQGLYHQMLMNNLNLVPFKMVLEFACAAFLGAGTDHISVRHAVINLAGNVVMFIPLGFFLPCVWPKLRDAKLLLLYVAAIILVIEIVQLFTLLGSCDVDDLMLNVFGAMIGYMLFRIIYKSRHKDIY